MNGIGFKNMKVFKENQWFDFKDITLLTGTNNSGKSSIINAMQMLQENINVRNIDDLIKTEFKLKANHNKYGSVETFVNNESLGKDDYFIFSRKSDNIEYRVNVQVNKGLESYGSVKAIEAIDIKSQSLIFVLNIKSPYPDYQCTININFKYFVERFYEKCKNTEILFRRKIELDELVKKVNCGKKDAKELEDFANAVSQEVSAYISVDEGGESFSVDELANNKYNPVLEDENRAHYFYIIHDDDKQDFYKSQKIDEVKVFFTRENKFSFKGFISEEDYINLYASAYKYGIFDFTQLWENSPVFKLEFEELICSYYDKEIEQSYKLLCDDLLALLSNNIWDLKEKYRDLETPQPDNLIENSTEDYINSFLDFGLIGSIVKFKDKDDNLRNYNHNPRIHAKLNFNKDSDEFKRLKESNFINTIFLKLSEIVIEKFNFNVKNYQRDLEMNFLGSEIDRINTYYESVFEEIFSEITKKVIKLNIGFYNVYVSSNRFATKRAYSFNDNTDFSNLLQQVEYSKKGNKETCKEFINKWIKEFEIADELILKPDSETGNFKAYLRVAEKNTLLADFGQGTNQLLPIIFSLGIHSYYATIDDDVLLPRTVVIEEPEANLHPAMQSKLADLFIDATKKFNVKIIAETHSEYLIRKLQYLVASSKAKPEDIAIYYFYKPNDHKVINGEVNQVEKIELDEFGNMNKDFGTGFFDEAITWKFELLKLKNAQKN